jgi:hypothetical protein
MSTNVEIGGNTATVAGTTGQLAVTENFGFFGDQGIKVTSLPQFVALFNAFKAEVPKAWPGVELSIAVPSAKSRPF